MKISDHIHQGEAGGAALRLVHRPVESVVTIVGSFDTHPDLGGREDLVQEVVVELLDKGTTERDRFEIAREIEDRGADIGFGSHGLSVHFAAIVLKHDVEDVLHLIAEQLQIPAFEETEFEKAKHQLGSAIRRSIDSTAVRAGSALRSELFAPGHPNHGHSPADDVEALEDVTLDDVRRFHDEHFTARSLVLCATGDLDVSTFEQATASAFAGFGSKNGAPSLPASRDSPTSSKPVDFLGSLEAVDSAAKPQPTYDPYRHLVREPKPSRIDVPISDRMNLDVRVGAGVELRSDDPDFVALHVGNYILGGNFSARLMSYVREELGLTYGISAALTGFDRAYDGFWQISVTLSRENLTAGIESTMATLERFVSDGITTDELAAKQQTLCGLFKVGLSTTRGLAQAMHGHFRNGFDPSYIDEYPEIISGLTVAQVNEAIQRYLRADRFVTAVAGTLL